MPQSIGKRIAKLRQQHGWTQQYLANRLAISRVAVSHIETDLSTPGERTITLLAGLFKLTPQALVEGTIYPPAKAERLPPVTCAYTQLELELALLDRDLNWLTRLEATPQRYEWVTEIREYWRSRLARWTDKRSDSWRLLDEDEEKMILTARRRLLKVCRQSSKPDTKNI